MVEAQVKASLRRLARARIADLAVAARPGLSRQACDRVVNSSVFAAANSLLLYMPLAGELDVRPIFEAAQGQGKLVALPRFVPETNRYAAFFVGSKPLIPGAFGVLEPDGSIPVALNQLDLIVAPGLGFDLRGRRLGRGKGFYDRLLSEVTGVKCGVCFDEQVVERIPTEPHDVGVDFLATPTRWQDCRGSTPEKQ